MKTYHLCLAIFVGAVAGYSGGRLASEAFAGTGSPPLSLRVLPDSRVLEPSDSAMPSSAGITDSNLKKASTLNIANAFDASSTAETCMIIERAVNTMESVDLQEMFDGYERFSREEQLIALPIAIKRWAILDESAATAWLVSASQSFRKGSTTFREIMRQFSEAAPAGAERLLGLVDSSEGKAILYRVTLERRAERDLPGAIKVMQSLPDGSQERMEAAQGILQTCADRHSDQFFSSFAKELFAKNPVWRSNFLVSMARNYARNGFGDMEDVLGKLDNAKERATILNTAVQSMGIAGLESMSNYYFRQVASEPELATLFTGQDVILERIAKKDGVEALRLCESIPESKRKASQLSAIYHWASAQPDAAMKWAESQTDKREQQAATGEVFRGWATHATGDAVAWLNKQPESKSKTELIEIAAREFVAQGNHEKALDWLERLGPSEQRQLASDVAYSLAQKDPESAARWLKHIEPDKDVAHNFGRVAECWADKDYTKATAWISALPSGITKDSAVERFAAAVAVRNPPAAAEWAMTIQDLEVRARAVSSIFYDWAPRDRRSAVEWAKRSGIPEQALKKLIR